MQPAVNLGDTFFLHLALPQAVERHRSAARLLSEVEGYSSPFVVAPATAVRQERVAPFSRSPRPLEASTHPTPPPCTLRRPSPSRAGPPR
ncbi:hypothetical protein SCP_0100040 [Sparassis crispa]|uniref:Uncharacterized protein n=1 Tax=Sparassis crispa TaxID=139825 RepID=A0A401G4R1_9APHY|nr:hypothetical protein SCP_0100040 [Sparassis crispa]GBE77132.1 hypothetical protein SCP_0100040 [Sparassis crispa]